MYYIWTKEKTTGPYTLTELCEVNEKFPPKEGYKVLYETSRTKEIFLKED